MGFSEYEYFDCYDDDQVEKLREERANKYMNLIRKWHIANEKGDDESMKKAIRAISKHKEADKGIKEKAKRAGSYWY